MARRMYTEEFRIEAVKQVMENGYKIADTAHRLGVHPDSLWAWIKRFESPKAVAHNEIYLSRSLPHVLLIPL